MDCQRSGSSRALKSSKSLKKKQRKAHKVCHGEQEICLSVVVWATKIASTKDVYTPPAMELVDSYLCTLTCINSYGVPHVEFRTTKDSDGVGHTAVVHAGSSAITQQAS